MKKIVIFTLAGCIIPYMLLAQYTQQGPKIKGSDNIGTYDYMGYSVAISSNADTYIAGGPYDLLGFGAAWVFATQSAGITPISSGIPQGMSLFQNYPNPFTANTKIKFQVSELSGTKIRVSDMMGKEVSILLDQQLEPGMYEVDFNGNNIAAGPYYYQLVTDGSVEVKKMILIK